MKIYCDTNVLIAASAEMHTHHATALEALHSFRTTGSTGVISAHGMAEYYSVLTRLPAPHRISPQIAWQLLDVNLMEAFEIVALSAKEYEQVIRDCAQLGWGGGRVYDALHLAVARKTKCDRIYTFNRRHFRQLAPDLSDRIIEP